MSALRRLALGALLAAAAPAFAASTTFSGTLDLRAGYGSNPYLSSINRGGSGLVGGTLSGGLVSVASTSTTSLTGVADYSRNFSHYGGNQNYTVDLNRNQRLSERVTVFGDVGYANTLNPGVSYQNTFSSGAIYQNVATTVITPTTAGTAPLGGTSATAAASDPTLVATTPIAALPVGVFDASTLDLFTLGQRSQRISGSGGLSWTPTARDQISVSGSASRVTYAHLDYDYRQYGANGSFLHTLSARTRVGVDGGVNIVDSANYPESRSYSANLVLVQQLSAIWSFNGRVGVIVPEGGYSRGNGASLGFSGTLCGTYPRSSFCFSAARQAAPTGIGGLRTDLQFTGSLSYALDERTRVNASATYDHSKAQSLVPGQDFYQASVGASRDLSHRFAIGGSARYQRRSSSGGFGAASGYAVTIDLITRFGHVAR